MYRKQSFHLVTAVEQFTEIQPTTIIDLDLWYIESKYL